MILSPSLGFCQVEKFDTVVAEDNLYVGSRNPTVESSALVQLDSTTSGLLIPRMTEAERDLIASPATSLLIFNTTANQYNYYDGSVWLNIGGSADSMPDGTEGSPGLSFANDTDNGFYRDSADKWAMSRAGSKALFFGENPLGSTTFGFNATPDDASNNTFIYAERAYNGTALVDLFNPTSDTAAGAGMSIRADSARLFLGARSSGYTAGVGGGANRVQLIGFGANEQGMDFMVEDNTKDFRFYLGPLTTPELVAFIDLASITLDNEKALRFREDGANGTNYVAFKAPDSIGSDVTFTLPAADGSDGQVLTTDGAGNLAFETPSGVVDETQQVSLSGSNATTTANSWINAYGGGGDLTLTAGKWSLCYFVSTFMNRTGSNSTYSCNVGILNATDAIRYTDSISITRSYLISTDLTNINFSASRCIEVDLAGTKTMRLQLRASSSNANVTCQITGNSFTGGLTDPDNGNIFIARRLTN